MKLRRMVSMILSFVMLTASLTANQSIANAMGTKDAVATNLFGNGGFETIITDTLDPDYAALQEAQISTTGKTIKDFWPDGRVSPIFYEANGGTGSLVFNSDGEAENIKEGSKSLKISMNDANRYIILRASDKLEYNKTYKLSFWYKAENIATTATGTNVPLIRREILNASWGAASRTALFNFPAGETGWTLYETEFKVGASGNNNFQLVIQVANHNAGNTTSGTIWLDDLVMREVELATSVTVNPALKEIGIGEEISLSASVLPATASQAVTWSSSNINVAVVDSNGVVRGVAPGSAVITATAKDGSGKFGTSDITVTNETLPQTAKAALALVGTKPPTIVDGKLVFPEIAQGYELSLYGSDNQQVIQMDGTIIQPLVDMDVNILYKATNKSDANDVATNWEDSAVAIGSLGLRNYSAADIKVKVPGKYVMTQDVNSVPDVMPGLREWIGSTGDFKMTASSKVIIDAGSTDLIEISDTIKIYFSDMLKRDVEVVVGGSPSTGDILLVKDNTKAELGKEGYLLEIDDYVKITAPENIGVLYGAISITQIMYQSDDLGTIPKGTARDYPKYAVRAGMIDVGRMFISLEYLEEMSIYMAWYKLNEAHIHINDYWKAANNYQAFRVESKKFPSITAKDGFYSQEDYKAFQLKLQKFGIDTVTEIDTPYHAECFRVLADEGMDLPFLSTPGYFDITTDTKRIKVQDFIEDLFDEFLDGEDPLVKSTKFHVGTDEYSKSYGEQMRKFTDHLIKYVNNKGFESRLWGSIGKNGFNGTTPVTNNAVMNLWAHYWTDVKEMYDEGYDIINTNGGWLYIVPAANAGYPDYLPIKANYDAFDVNNFNPSRNRSKGVAIMPMAHPQTVGASFAVWNDMIAFKGGYSWNDVYHRFKDAVMLTAEKTWYGEKTSGQTAAQFMDRVAKLNTRAAGANPGRYVETETETVFASDAFRLESDGKTIKDTSGNGYDAIAVNGTNASDGKGVSFNGDGYIEMPVDSIMYPFTVFMDVKLATQSPDNTEFFSGADGVMAPYDMWGKETGKMGYFRGSEGTAYSFVFEYKVPKSRWVSLAIVGDAVNTTLYIDGEKISTGASQVTPINSRKDSNTFVLPLEQIFKNGVGTIDSLEVYNRDFNSAEVAERYGIESDNIALHKKATASSVHPSLVNCTPGKAVDGVVDTVLKSDYRWASQRATGVAGTPTSEYGPTQQWLEVDLGKEESVGKILINWENAYASEYKIMGSLDGVEYFEIAHITNGAAGEKTFDDINKNARFLKVECIKPFNGSWGYSIYEFEVYRAEYNPDSVYILDVVNLNDAIIGETTVTATVDETVEKLIPELVVTEGATWKLYSDSEFKNEITNKEMAINTGNNTTFIKVESEKTSRLYVLNIVSVISGTTDPADPLSWYSKKTYMDGFHNNFGSFDGNIVTLEFNITPENLPNATGVAVVIDGAPAGAPHASSNTTGSTTWAPVVIRFAGSKVDVHNGPNAGTWLGNGAIEKGVAFDLKVDVDRINSKFKVFINGEALYDGWASFRRQTPLLEEISMVYIGGSGVDNDFKVNSFKISESPESVNIPVYVMDSNAKKVAGLDYQGEGNIYESVFTSIGGKFVAYAPEVEGYNLIGKSSVTIVSANESSSVMFVYEKIVTALEAYLAFDLKPTESKSVVRANIHNGSSESASIIMIAALYDDQGKMVDVFEKEIDIEAGEKGKFDLDCTYEAKPEYTLKAFLWINNEFVPLCDSISDKIK